MVNLYLWITPISSFQVFRTNCRRRDSLVVEALARYIDDLGSVPHMGTMREAVLLKYG